MSREQPAADDAALSKATEQLIETVPADAPEPAKVGESFDDREYREALEALKAEQAPPAKEPEPKVEPKEEPKAPEPETAPVVKEPDAKPIMIPKARLDEVLRERDELKNTANYFKGIVDANKEFRSQAPKDQPKEAVKTHDQLLDEVDAEKRAVAKQYDEAQITASQWTERQIQLDRQAAAIRADLSKTDNERVRREATAEARREAMALSLEDHAARMDTQHPGLKLMPDSSDHPMWGMLKEKALQSLDAEGIALTEGDARSTMIYRERMAQLADKYAPVWTEKDLPGTTTDTSPPAPQPNVKRPSIADQRLKKIDLAHQQPPDTGKLGSSGTKPELTDAQVLNMTDEELMALPAQTLARVKG